MRVLWHQKPDGNCYHLAKGGRNWVVKEQPAQKTGQTVAFKEIRLINLTDKQFIASFQPGDLPSFTLDYALV